MERILVRKPWVNQQDVSYTSWKNITPNIVIVPTESNGHQTPLTHQDFFVIHPCNVIRTYVSLKLKLQFINEFL